jgi:hypothetical protein
MPQRINPQPRQSDPQHPKRKMPELRSEHLQTSPPIPPRHPQQTQHQREIRRLDDGGAGGSFFQ